MHTGGRAVFLSYAREDADAVRRIADALRAFGTEVWFDQNELRGGDAWDSSIRRQIRECALFVPVISATTQARGEGYFRREWRLAVERMQDMAAGIPFLLPVVIDDTPEKGALVPDEFMRVQWTRLPRGVPSPAFVEQVKKLLVNRASPAGPAPVDAVPSSGAAKKPVPAIALAIALGGMAVSVGLALFVTLRKKGEPATPAPATVEAKPAAPAAKPARLADKSIAVLPFANMSEEKDASAFFADGVHEDVLTNLALIRELRVVSRTSVQSYRGTTKSMKQIAEELGVTYILEGSVRRFGNKVRVTGQLIHAATDEHVWAATYDRDLTDIFAIQTELSRQIAAALKTALTPAEEAQIARKRTTNPAAYDHFLRARDIFNREGNTISARDRRILHLRQAVETDPDFAEGWSELATAYAFRAFSFEAGMDDYLALAKSAIDRAELLAPTDPEVRRNIGTFHYYGYRDYERALQEYRRIAQEQPNDPPTMNSLGLILRRQGKWAESLVYSRRAVELDPANIGYIRNLASTLAASRRWEELRMVDRRMAALLPDDLELAYRVASTSFFATGETREANEFFRRMDAAAFDSPRGIDLRRIWAGLKGDLAEVIRLDRLQPYFDEDGDPRYSQAYFAARSYYRSGDHAGAIQRLGDFPRQLREQFAREPKNARLCSLLAGMELMLGNGAEARRLIDRACELMPVERDALDGPLCLAIRAWMLAHIGDTDRALEEYRRVLRTPCTNLGLVNVHALRSSWTAEKLPLLSDPRFEALLNDPKNNQPLF